MSTVTQDGESALMKASSYGHTEVVVELVRAGANKDLQNKVCMSQASNKCLTLYE